MLVPEPDALNAHVRFDEGSVETATEATLLRHRRTKGAANRYARPTAAAPHSDSTDCVEKLRLIGVLVADSLCWVQEIRPMMGERRVMQEALFYGFSL